MSEVDTTSCSIKVVCRIRPLNESEEKAGSKFIVKFPSEESISIAVSVFVAANEIHILRFFCALNASKSYI